MALSPPKPHPKRAHTQTPLGHRAQCAGARTSQCTNPVPEEAPPPHRDICQTVPPTCAFWVGGHLLEKLTVSVGATAERFTFRSCPDAQK